MDYWFIYIYETLDRILVNYWHIDMRHEVSVGRAVSKEKSLLDFAIYIFPLAGKAGLWRVELEQSLIWGSGFGPRPL